MTYRHDSEIYLSYGTFINKTNKEKIKPNAFLKYDEKSHSVFNLTRYKIPELSHRKKGSNFTSKLVQYMQSSKFPRHCKLFFLKSNQINMDAAIFMYLYKYVMLL